MLPPASLRRGALPALLRRLTETKIGVVLLVLGSLVPVVSIWFLALGANRNVAYWDELDSAIAFLLRIDAGQSWTDTVGQIFAVTNEHRTATSRALFALSYWTTGSINFYVIGVIGNLFITTLVVMLVAATRDAERRLRVFALLAFLLFSLAHAENFFWSGASIDHFQVVMLAGAALIALTRDTWGNAILAMGCALLATFTLAHGLIVWVVGAAMLIVDRRRQLGVWLGIAVIAGALYFQGFTFNPGHGISGLSFATVGRIANFWVVLLGAPAAIGNLALAPFLGLAWLGLFGSCLVQRVAREERWLVPLIAWAALSLLMVAYGRAGVNTGDPHSRYYVLSALTWALTLHLAFDRHAEGRRLRPRVALIAAFPVLVAFNVVTNACFAPMAKTWTFTRNAAADSYVRTGRDGKCLHRLHPRPEHATRLLHEAERRGIYRMPTGSDEIEPEHIRPADTPIAYYIDQIATDERLVTIEGWAAFPKRESKRGEIDVLLKTPNGMRQFTTVAVDRDDVARAYPAERWKESGFRVQIYRGLLPPGVHQLGLCIGTGSEDQYVLTDHHIELEGAGLAPPPESATLASDTRRP